MRSAVLTFNISGTRLGQLRFICMRLGIPLRAVPARCWESPLGELWQAAQLPEADDTPAPFTDEMLVMCGFSGQQLNALLAAMKQNRLSPVALKAMLTPTNRDWNALQLHEELRKEHAAMHGGGQSAHQDA